MTARQPTHDEVQLRTCSFLLGWTCKHTEPTSGGSSNQSPRLWGRPAGCKAVRVGSRCTRVPADGWRCDRTAPGGNPAGAAQGSDPSRAACCTQPGPRGLVWGKDTSGQTGRGVSAPLLRGAHCLKVGHWQNHSDPDQKQNKATVEYVHVNPRIKFCKLNFVTKILKLLNLES